MIDTICEEIKKHKDLYGLSLAQFGSMVGAPAPTVKRWIEGVKPQDRFYFQIILVLGLMGDPREIYFDLSRQGIKINPAHWDSFANLVLYTGESIRTAAEAGLQKPDVAMAMVSGVNGMLALISGAFAADGRLGVKAGEKLTTTIATVLKDL